MQYKIKSNIKEVMLKWGGQLTPDVRGKTLEDYLVGCIFEESKYRKFAYEKYTVLAEADVVVGTVLRTDHPMPYENVSVWLPRECLEKI